MTSNTLKRFIFTALVVCVSGLSLSDGAAKGVSNVTKNKPTERITLDLGKAEVVKIDDDVIADILVSNPTIVEIGPVKGDQLYLIGSALGDTNVLLFDEDGDLMRQLAVHVRADISALQANLKTMFPDEKIKVHSSGNQVMIDGTVTSANVAASVRDVASRYAGENQTIVNHLKVAGEQQVMINVKVVEVSRSVLNELGIETDVTNITSGNYTAANATADSLGLTVDPSFAAATLIYNTTGTGPIQLALRALERDGLVNTLAQPNLTAVSGENARFLAGGEFPIPSARDNNGNIIYEYRPFGISLAFKPIVLDEGRINLQISTEVSEVSTDLTLQLPGITVPSFSVRRAETTVELASGGSLMIAGLIESQAIERMNTLPGIGSIPVLGALVRSESFTRNESELLVMISAYLVEPFAEPAAERVITADARTQPLNLALAEALAIAYGDAISPYAGQGQSFGFIVE